MVEDNLLPNPKSPSKTSNKKAAKKKKKKNVTVPPTFLTPPRPDDFRRYFEKKVTTEAITYRTDSKYNIVFKDARVKDEKKSRKSARLKQDSGGKSRLKKKKELQRHSYTNKNKGRLSKIMQSIYNFLGIK